MVDLNFWWETGNLSIINGTDIPHQISPVLFLCSLFWPSFSLSFFFVLGFFQKGAFDPTREDFLEEAGHGLNRTWMEEESCARRGHCTCRRGEAGKRGVKVRPPSRALLPVVWRVRVWVLESDRPGTTCFYYDFGQVLSAEWKSCKNNP